jgi:hypothetical protein
MNIDPDSIRLVGEADLLELVGLGRGAWNGWVKSDHVSQSSDGLYREQDVIELAVLRLMADWMPMAKAVISWRDCQADLISRCTERRLDDDRAIDLVVDLHTLGADCVEDPQDLFDRLHAPVPSPRAKIVIVLGPIIHELRAAFWRRARPASDFVADKRRRSARGVSTDSGKAVPIAKAGDEQANGVRAGD